MVYVKWVFWGAIWLIAVAFAHYTLPQHDIVRITKTYESIDPIKYPLLWSNANSDGTRSGEKRDVFFIQSFRTNDKPMIYRNEDTDWGWPPYFKFDTSNLQAEATDLVSVADDPVWVAVRHYGWRNEFLSSYPNAISVRQVDGPDVRIIPWLNIVVLTSLFALFWAIRVRWKRFRENRINPVIDEWTDGWG